MKQKKISDKNGRITPRQLSYLMGEFRIKNEIAVKMTKECASDLIDALKMMQHSFFDEDVTAYRALVDAINRGETLEQAQGALPAPGQHVQGFLVEISWGQNETLGHKETHWGEAKIFDAAGQLLETVRHSKQ
jgi:hypothetical protein